MFLHKKSITEYLGSIADTAVSSYPSINPTDLESINVVIPDERLIKAFDETISPLYELKEDSAKTIQTLIKQRDELLPLLMNGQVSLNSDLSNRIIEFYCLYTLELMPSLITDVILLILIVHAVALSSLSSRLAYS